MYTTQSILVPIFKYTKCDIIPEYIRYASTHNEYHISIINVLYSSLDVCFCFMFPQTKYEYDLLLLMQNDSLYFIYPFILHYYRMFSIPFKYIIYLIYQIRLPIVIGESEWCLMGQKIRNYLTTVILSILFPIAR